MGQTNVEHAGYLLCENILEPIDEKAIRYNCGVSQKLHHD